MIMTLDIIGNVIKQEDGTGFAGFRMEIFAIDQLLFEEKVGEVVSTNSGEFRISLDDSDYLKKFGEGYGIYLITYNANNVLLSHGRYDQQGKIKWSAKNLVMFDMVFPANVIDKKPPEFDKLFDEKSFFDDLKDIK